MGAKEADKFLGVALLLTPSAEPGYEDEEEDHRRNVRGPTFDDAKCGGFPTWLVPIFGNPNVARHRAPNHVRSKKIVVMGIFAHLRFDQSGGVAVV